MIFAAGVTLLAGYLSGVLFSYLDKVYTKTFATRLEAVTRSREVKRDMKVLREQVDRETRSVFTWPLGVALVLIERYQKKQEAGAGDK
jgi:hypothetical protein